MPSNSTDLKDLNANNLKLGTIPAANLGTFIGNSPVLTAIYICGNSVWTPPAPPAAGADTQIQYNSSGIIGAGSNFTFNYTTNTLTVTSLVSGGGAGITNLNASNIASGTMATARLGSGTASTSTFLRGDSTWQTPPVTPPAGNNMTVQFNNNGVFGGNPNFTFNSTATPPLAAYNGALDVTAVSGPSLRLWDTSPAVKGGFTSYGTPYGTLATPCACGRLTFDSAHPAPNGSYATTATATLYYLPMNGNQITLWNSTLNDFENIIIPDAGWSLNMTNLCSNPNIGYDVFVTNNLTNGTAQLTVVSWGSVTNRVTAISSVNGMLFQSGSQNSRYVGSLQTIAAGQSADNPVNRFLWNAHNQVPRKLFLAYPTNNWTYSVASGSGTNVRPVNNDPGTRLWFFIGMLSSNMGVAGIPWLLIDSAQLFVLPASMAALGGVNLNTYNPTSWSNEIQSQCNSANQSMLWNRFCPTTQMAVLGQNFLTLVEAVVNNSGATGGPTFYGGNAWCVMTGYIWC